MHALEHCITIWESVREQSIEAYKACGALRVMVDKLRVHQTQKSQPPSLASFAGRSGQNFGMFANGNVADVNADDLPPEQSRCHDIGHAIIRWRISWPRALV